MSADKLSVDYSEKGEGEKEEKIEVISGAEMLKRKLNG